MKRTIPIKNNSIANFALLLALGIGITALVQAGKKPAARDPKWAQPIAMSGLPNLNIISDNLYRGAQPTAEGFKALKKMGVKTVVSLRAGDSDKKLIGATGLAYENIPCRVWRIKDENVAKFLKIATDTARHPVFLHCEHGSDRTGIMCAAYRIVIQGWTKDDAIKEMKEGGYGYHAIWINLARHIKGMDIDAIRKMMASSPSQTK